MKRTLSPRHPIAVLVLGACLTNAWPAYAGSDGQLPPEQEVGRATYVSGGIGQDEADAMKRAAASYPLGLMFIARQDGRNVYLAGTDVTVRDKDGNVVLTAVADGPFLLARLPAGRYTVEATFLDQTQVRSATVNPHRHVNLVFEW